MLNTGHYSRRKERMLRDFDGVARLVKGFVADRYDKGFAERLHRAAIREYAAIVPQIPHIRGVRGRPLNAFLRVTAQEVAVYKAMKSHGKTARDAWEICHEAIRRRMKQYPRWKIWLLERLFFSPPVKHRVRRRADRKEPLRIGDFEMRYLVGNGEDFDWGVDYVRCGNLELVKKLGAEEFAPYVCLSDIPLGDALGWGVTRTQTLADGCDHCDFRFKRGERTRITSRTSEVQETVERVCAAPRQ